MRDERLWRDTCQNFVTSEQCRVCRPQFPQCTHGTPGTMTPLLAGKTVAFYDSGFPTEARVTSLPLPPERLFCSCLCIQWFVYVDAIF